MGDIWVMEADGGSPVNLTPDPLPGITDEERPAWSPDGHRIACASTASGTRNIWTMAADGTDKRQVTAAPGADTEPAWSPDGRRIAFRRTRPGLGSDLMIVGAGGGAVLQLPLQRDERAPAWSPGGGLLAFAVYPGAGGSPQIYTMTPVGAELVLRTSDVGWNGGSQPAWIRRL